VVEGVGVVAGGIAVLPVAVLPEVDGVAAKAALALASAMAAARQGKAERMKLSWFIPPQPASNSFLPRSFPKKRRHISATKRQDWRRCELPAVLLE
jgi:hypothetical protein